MNTSYKNIHISLYGAALLATLPVLIMLPGCSGGSGGLIPGGTSTPQPTTSATNTGTPTETTTPGGTQTATPGGTTTATPTGTRTATPSGTSRPTPSGSATSIPSGTATSTPGGSATATPRGTATPTPRATTKATPRPTSTPTPHPTVSPTVDPTPTPIPGLGAPIFFDAFLADNAGQPREDFNGFFQWNVTGGTVDLWGGRVPGATDQTNGRFVDLDGGRSGRFATRVPLPFTANVTYNLRFDYLSTDGNSNSATISLGSQTFRVITSARGLQSFSRDFSFPTATTTQLVFQDAGNDGNGIGIDNVVVSQRLTN